MKNWWLGIIILLLLTAYHSFGQLKPLINPDSTHTLRLEDLGPPNDFSCVGKWRYFSMGLYDTLFGEVIQHKPAEVGCGVYMFASLTIVRYQIKPFGKSKVTGRKKMARILDQCNTNRNIYPGDKIYVIWSGKGSGRLPFSSDGFGKGIAPDKYDHQIKTTMWGFIFKLPEP